MIENLKQKFSFNSRILFEIIIASLFFGLVLFEIVTLFKVIATLLSFMIILEVVRMLGEFAFNKNHVMKLRFVIDGVILFFLRELILISANEKYDWDTIKDKIEFYLLVLFVLFILRVLALIFSPNDKNCESCVAVPTFKQYFNKDKKEEKNS